MSETIQPSPSSSTPPSSWKNKYQFWLIFFLAFILLEIPIISIPLKWFESYFHEISHGLAAIISGGQIVKIQLFPNGAGLCTTRGGSTFLISFFGYAGAALWGMLIYWLASMHRRVAQIVSSVIGLLLIISLIFWIRDLLSFAIMAVLLLVILLKFKLQNLVYFTFILQLIGATVLLNSIKSPWYLLDGRSLGDGAALANLTMIPEIIWIGLWFTIGVICVIALAKQNLKKK